MADEIVDGPDGAVRIPESIGPGEYAQDYWLNFQQERVQLTFTKPTPAEDTVAEGVGRIWLERQRFYEWVDALVETRRLMQGYGPGMATLTVKISGKDEHDEEVSLTFDRLILDVNQQEMVLGSRVHLAGPEWERTVTVDHVTIEGQN